ncbi:hypothetical protein RchiOBHm_Chr2g0110911 [Rosa chinensis]|uniref:Uncharacterized protein n=1 Tax=Rosa chinensis TaxID=74649 RepID=A0A2P6RPT3_ROSCH|nr:hypothetical protein RchiOBHm_Chr2g0110911 [Rosa chinensis]
MINRSAGFKFSEKHPFAANQRTISFIYTLWCTFLSSPYIYHSESDTVPLQPSSQSDINEIKNQINASIQSSPATVLPAKPPSPIAPPSPSPPPPSSNLTSPTDPSLLFQAQAAAVCSRPPRVPSAANNNGPINIAASGFGIPSRGLVSYCHQFEARRLPNPYCVDPEKALRDWGLCGPFFFIVFLGPTLSWSASVKKGFEEELLEKEVTKAAESLSSRTLNPTNPTHPFLQNALNSSVFHSKTGVSFLSVLAGTQRFLGFGLIPLLWQSLILKEKDV